MTDEFDSAGAPINITVSHKHYWDLRQEIVFYRQKMFELEQEIKKIKRGILGINEDLKELLT
jgi:hypothetical protein